MSADAEVDGVDDGLLKELFAYLDEDGDARDINVLAWSSSSEGQELSVPHSDQGPAREEQKQTVTRQTKHPGAKAPKGIPSGGGGRSKRQRDADKVRELEAIAAAKMEQFAALMQRNSELRFRSKILSDAVMLRDYQLHIVKHGGGSPAPWPIPHLPEHAVDGTSTSSKSDSVLMQPQLMPSTAQIVHTPGSVRLLVAPELLATIEQSDVRSMGRLQVAESWKAFLSEASLLLLALEANPADEAAACRLKHIAAVISSLCRRMSILSPATMLAVWERHLETDALAAPEPGFWAGVLQTLRLTDEQLREMRAVFELYSGIMRRILAERGAIQSQLSAGLQPDQRAMAAQMRVPPEEVVLPALERSLRKEGAAHLLVRAFLFGRTFSIVQMCRVAVQSYPFFPSTTGLAAVAAGVSV